MALPWSFVSKITNSKHPARKTAGKQITNKSQIQNSKPVQGDCFLWDFEFRSLLFICFLGFVI
jgi:hypothetical protein